MKGLADGRIEATETVRGHLDMCLDCRACETACPSGVVYHELIEETRAKLGDGGTGKRRTFGRWLVDFVCFRIMPYPWRLKLALAPARVLQKVGLWGIVSGLARRVLGEQIGKMQQMLPRKGGFWPTHGAERYEAEGPRKMTVGMMAGCVGSVMFGETNRKAIRLLQRMGCEVVVPREQVCCGAIHHHGGKVEKAKAFARHNVEVFENVDVVVSTIAGCGAMLKEYGHLLGEDEEWAERAERVGGMVMDVSELMATLEPEEPEYGVEMKATYHDACHLAHGQGVRSEPRALLGMVKGLEMVGLRESDTCCGAAGTYNLTQVETAKRLANRKIGNIEKTGCEVCITGNVGCAMQIQSEAEGMGKKIKVLHPVDVLYAAYFGEEVC